MGQREHFLGEQREQLPLMGGGHLPKEAINEQESCNQAPD